VRRSLSSRILGLGVAIAASVSVVLSAAPAAHAANTDVITAAGSDTTQNVMAKILADDGTAGKTFNILAGNNQSTALPVPADGFCLAHTYHNQAVSNSWPNAGSPGQTGSEIPAPNGSGQGKTALNFSIAATAPFNGGGAEVAPNGCIDVARSSGARSSGDPSTYEYYAFAQDVITWGSTSLSAPASLTQAQLQGIYNCTFTNWNQVGGTSGPIQRVLPQSGSGTLNTFLASVLGVSAQSSLPVGATGTACPPIENIEENQYYDLLNGSSVYGPQGDATTYANAIGPFSNGQWVGQSLHASNPTVDLRAGWRPGALVVQQGTDGNNPVTGVVWTGSQWSLNTGSVVGSGTPSPRSENLTTTAGSNQVVLVPSLTAVSGISTTLNTFTLSAAPGTFTQAMVNGPISDGGVNIGVGAVISAISSDGSTATVTVKSLATASGVSANVSSHFNAGDAGAVLSVNTHLSAGTTIQFVIDGTHAEISQPAATAGTGAATTVTPVGQVHNVTGLTTTLHGTTIAAAAATFSASDQGKTIDSTCTGAGTTISSVAGDGSSITITPGASAACTSLSARIGFAVVSPGNILAASGPSAPFAGGRFVYNVIDTREPSYTQAQALVGYVDSPCGAKSPLCSSAHDSSNGGSNDRISDAGFLPIQPHTSAGNNTAVSCLKF
jgi:phosphate transport system substrate-binding protein